jgi:SAM-dependent methyltransferase
MGSRSWASSSSDTGVRRRALAAAWDGRYVGPVALGLAELIVRPEDGVHEIGRMDERLRSGLIDHLRELVLAASGRPLECEPIARDLVAWLLERNQFVVIGADEQRSLGVLVEGVIADLRRDAPQGAEPDALRAALDGALVRRADEADRFVRDLCAANLGAAFVRGEPTSSEYSPELQLEVLGARPEDLAEPVLDLGCGPGAALVRHLRSRGRRAFGVDRAISATSPSTFLTRADWLECRLGRGIWGTVLSHMAFSNHFLHHHLRPGGDAERYARRYMEVLRSLRPGGRFLYAPGLPFIESLLPRGEYLVEKTAVSALAGSEVDDSLRAALGARVLYSCSVVRRPPQGA